MYNDKQIKRYFDLAKKVSKLSDYETNKTGAILVHKNKILSVGCNKKQSSPIQKKYNIYRTTNKRVYDVNKQNNYTHAEISCLQGYTRHIKNCSIFVYREKKDGSIGLSKPCNACSMYLKDKGVKNIYYTTDNGWKYERRE